MTDRSSRKTLRLTAGDCSNCSRTLNGASSVLNQVSTVRNEFSATSKSDSQPARICDRNDPVVLMSTTRTLLKGTCSAALVVRSLNVAKVPCPARMSTSASDPASAGRMVVALSMLSTKRLTWKFAISTSATFVPKNISTRDDAPAIDSSIAIGIWARCQNPLAVTSVVP